MRVDVGDLADADDVAAGIDEFVEHGRCVRRRGQVATVAGADEARCIVADERTRDNTTDPVFVDELTRDVAELVQPVEAERLLVRGDLEHAVGRRVDDRLAGRHVLLAEFGDDRRTGRMAVTQHAGQVGPLDEFVEQFLRESLLFVSEVAPVEQHRHAGNLPVTARRVLAARQFLGVTVGADDVGGGGDTGRVLAAALARRVVKAQAREIRQLERTLVGRGAFAGDAAQRVGALVAEAFGVGGGADAE